MWIQKSGITVLHYQACQVMPNSDSEILLVTPDTRDRYILFILFDLLSYIPFILQCQILDVESAKMHTFTIL